MSWLYSVSKSPNTLGVIAKEEGEIVLRTDRRYSYGAYDDYCFAPGKTNNKDRWVYLSTWDKPKNGFTYNRRVWLEEEDDEKALSIISKNYAEEIEKLKKRIANYEHMISMLRFEAEEEDENNEG